MKPASYTISLMFLLFCGNAFSQQLVRLKSRSFVPPKNISRSDTASPAKNASQFDGKIFAVIQFGKTPTEAEKQHLKNSGIELQQYIPDNAFTAVISKAVTAGVLEKANAIAVFELDPADKLGLRLAQKKIPAWAVKQAGTVDVIVHFNAAVSFLQAKDYLIQQGYTVIDDSWKDYHFFTLRIDQQKILQLASIPFVEYVEAIPPDPKTFNYLMRANTRANVLNADPSVGGEGLKGQGVTIGIGDDADPSSHVDLKDRVINRAAGPQNTHGTHVAGIAAGGGLKDPMFQGVAPLATIVSQLFNGIFLNAGAYTTDYHMMVTNNSWGNITGECDLTGVYDTYSKLMDDIAVQYPYLLNVFAAGNDGPFTCLGFPQQYHTIVSGHQAAKNVLTVGWSEKNFTVSPGSSVGPAADGRLKPEITSQGSGIRSTAPNNDYLTDWGTSMAAPTVSGGAALLIEKYRKMNGGADPKSGLIKALLMNGAKDIEQPAPDYKSGYGFLNLTRSLDILKNNRHLSATITAGAANTYTINVPAGLAQLKVMVYWHDPSAAIFAKNTLVNDLDLEVSTPAPATMLPWKLSGDSTTASTNAIRAADHINNSEQVTVDNPVTGSYTITIKGTAINSGTSQEYFVVYDYVPVAVDLTYPSVGEPFTPGEALVINWDSWGGPGNTFTLQYSIDGGVNWIDISTTIPSTARQYNWNAPTITDKAKLRLIKNGTGLMDESQPFVVLTQPTVALSPVQCEDYINITWDAISGATDYEVMMKKGPVMTSVATTTNTNYTFVGLNRDSTYWVTVQARINGKAGKRAVAINREPDNGNCTGSISDNDLKIDSIISPVSGRKFTSSWITTDKLVVRIKNLDDVPVTGFAVKYSINGSAYVINNVVATIAPNGTYVHTFTGLNFSAAGTYNIVAVVKNNAADLNTVNDTATKAVLQLPNAPVTLPYTENFDTAPVFEITKDTIALPALDKYDFINSTDQGRIRSFVNTGIAKSGNRALTLDATRYLPPGNTNYLVGTFNLGNYSGVLSQDLGLTLEFSYKHHGQTPHPDNRVWARRSDADAWEQVFSFDSVTLQPGEWRTVAIPLPNTAAVSFTSSFQMMFGQHGTFPMGDNTSSNGITIDDVKLLSAPYDVELVSIEDPSIHSCSFSQDVPLTIKYRDHRGISGCIPIKYRIQGGPVTTECFVSSGTGTYTFVNKLNLPATGTYMLEVWVDHPADSYRNNDTVRTTISNQPVLNNFPYIEHFENGTGNWHPEGYHSSWQYGPPASLKINKAASGTKAWKTSLRGQYNENELSYLYSPCFDISTLALPYLTFNIAVDLEQCRPFVCDKSWVEYSANGKTWIKLGAYGQGINWYNRQGENVWDSANHTTWHMAGIDLPSGLNQLQLRFVISSDQSVTREGVAIDDIRIFDKQVNPSHLDWKLYPNPTTGVTSLLSNHEPGKTVSLQLFNAAGQLIHHQTFVASGFPDNTDLNLSAFPKGVYALKVEDGGNKKVFKLVKH
jgi:hypothetical protein